jgi:NADPH2:quinone reductase
MKVNTMPTTMNAVFAREPGGPDVLELRATPMPEPRGGEVLIRVESAGVNRPDLRQRLGGYPPPPGVSEALGLEVAGEVVEAGAGVEGYRPGDKVCALVAGGGYAEYCVAPVEQVLPWPKGLSAVEAAALPETYFTVWTNLFRIGGLREGQTVLIHGGASGIGTTAIQLARAFGARVFVTAGTEEKCAACLELGAEAAINYRTSKFEEEIARLTEGRGVDVILDMICADYLARNLASLAIGGRLVVIAFLGGGKAEVDVEGMVRKRQTLCGSTLRPQTPAEKGLIAADLAQHVWPLLESGAVKPVIHRVFPLSDAPGAHRELEAGQHFGKVVMTV